MNTPITQNQLLSAARDGDPMALERLLAVSRPAVRRMALSQCSSRADADDAAQVTLLMVYRRLGALKTLSAFPGWLFAIVRRECWRLSRRLIGQVEYGARICDEEDHTVRDPSLQYDLVSAIRKLPPLYRQTLILRDVEQLTAAEVAARLGITEEAAKSRLHRARQLLRQALTV